MSTIIKIEGLTKGFGKETVLNELDFELKAGQVMGLLGRNGAGKSTLMKIILGLAYADSGRVELLGDASSSLSQQTKNNIAYVPQQALGFEAFKIEQLFKFIGRAYSSWDDNYAAELCRMFDLSRDKKVGALSGGQKQLVSIVLALAHKPKCLLLDEPVSALDPVNRREFLSEIIDLAVDNESTVLFSTHITSDLERIASHVSFLSQGKIILTSELEELKDSTYRIPTLVPLPSGVTSLYEGNDFMLVQTSDKSRLEGAQSLNLDDLFVALHDNEKK